MIAPNSDQVQFTVLINGYPRGPKGFHVGASSMTLQVEDWT